MKRDKLPLRACPFCGGNNIEDNYFYFHKKGDKKHYEEGHVIFCVDCLAEEPFAVKTKKGAIKAWNTRKEPK